MNHSNTKTTSDDPEATTGRRKAGAPSDKFDGVEETPFIEIYKSPIQLGSKKNEEEKYSELPTCSQNASYYFSQFCDATSIHGIKYLGERGRFLVEKIFWAIIIAVVCLLCIFLISKTYIKWVRTPVIVTFATTETAIWEIPFPAVTICPDIKFKPEIFNFSDTVLQQMLDYENETKYLNTLSLACDSSEEFLSEGTNFVNQTLVISHLLMALPGLNPHNMTDVIWMGKEHELDDVLSLTITSEGLCYSFNMLHYEEVLKQPEDKLAARSLPDSTSTKWSLEGGYPSDNDLASYPRRTFLSGIHGGVVFEPLFANQSHMDFLCTGGVQGFKVILHHPLELPNMDKHFRVPVDQAVNIAIKPKMIVVSEELKPYDPEVRKCYFDGEKFLAFFQSYTQQNCLDECLWNYTLIKCDCVAFHMTVNTDPPACGLRKLHCVEKSKVNYLADKDNNCNCLPPCTSLEYDVEVTQSHWDWYEVFDWFKRIGVIEQDEFRHKEARFSRLAVFYKDQQFLASERHELYGYIDFFANVGGLLGLFIGFSVTSLLEIVYFLSLRLGCNVRKFGRNFWSGEPELVNAEAKRD